MSDQSALPGFESFIGTNEDDVDVPPAALATTPSSVSIMSGFGYHDLDSFAADEVIIPKLRLAQGLSAEVVDGSAKSGQWVLTGFAPLDAATITPIKIQRRRTNYSQEEERVVCRSFDAIVGEGEPGGLCAECPLSMWTKLADGRSVGPRCTFIFSYLVHIKEHDTFAVVEFKKTSEKVAKQLNSWIMTRGLGNFSVLMTSETIKKPGRVYEVPHMTMVLE